MKYTKSIIYYHVQILYSLGNPIATSHSINFGQSVLPVKRVEIFTADEWESFIEEWLDVKKKDYKKIEKLAGAGDKGRDVVASIEENISHDNSWDCYQCKHYDKPLVPSQIWVEIAKIIYYTYKKDYSVPRKYFFTAPKGCGTSLSTLLDNPTELRNELKANWDQYCKNKITTTTDISLTNGFLSYFDSFDFSIFGKVSVKTIIEEHKNHPNHLIRFGGGLPLRTELIESDIPTTIQVNELVYVSQLLLAYSSDCSEEFKTITEIQEPYINHFKRARLNFHYAEQLRNLYRDSLPAGTFENFQNEIYDGTVNIYENNHSNGYEKVKAVESQAALIDISSNPLKEVSIQKDKIGVCHQLCNESKFKWIP